MKAWALVFGSAGIAAGLCGQGHPQKPWTLVIGGNLQGYLSPCGCTEPMSGGIRRWATAVRRAGNADRTVVLETGGMIGKDGLQDRYKAEALAEALSTVHIAAVNLTASEVRLGKGEISQLSQLSSAPFVSSALQENRELGLAPFVTDGPFLIGGGVVRPGGLAEVQPAPLSALDAARRLVGQAKASGLVPIFMLDGNRDEASEIAKTIPSIALIAYTMEGDPPFSPFFVGKTMLVTPGERGKSLVHLSYVNGVFAGYGTTDLGPVVKDDPLVSKIYSGYLRRVDGADLISAWPRKPTDPYAGTEKCGSCHQSAYVVWKNSKHSGAYSDLVDQGHGKDPDCVVCHVTALGSDSGFRDLLKTPSLGYVGCESCHGPGEQHALNPSVIKMQKVGEKSCLSCHEAENSPKFLFLTYWPRIIHR